MFIIQMRLDASDRPWFAATSDSASAFSNDTPAAATRVFDHLTAARAAMKHLAGVELELPIRAFACRGEACLRELVPQFWESPGVRPHAAAYAGPHAAFMAVRSDLPQPLLFPTIVHEYVHLLTAASGPDAPAWLDEGLAEFWSSIVISGDRIVIGPPQQKHLSVLRSRSWIPIDDMIAHRRGTLPPSRSQTAMFYAQAWAMVHYLLLGQDDDAPLSFMPANVPPLSQLDERVRVYVAEGRLRQRPVELRRQAADVPQPSRISEARSLAERANMLVFGPRVDAALPLVTKALDLESHSPVALEVMGTFFFLRNQPERAREWLTRSLDANPGSYVSALYLALLSSSTPDRERYLMSAVRAKPDSTLAWQRLWALYVEDGRAAIAQRWCRALPQLLLPWVQVDVPVRCGV